MMLQTNVLEREVYSELGQLAAAFTIEARRHFDVGVRDALDDVARYLHDYRVRYWAGKQTDREALAELIEAEGILDAVVGWDAL